MKLTNKWNLFVYRLWAPGYDKMMDRYFVSGRRRAIELAAMQPGERVLLVGVGTGTDLTLLPEGVHATGVDLSPDMLAVAAKKIPIPGRDIDLKICDAQALPFDAASFDCIVLDLILCVVPEPHLCLAEALRVLKPEGRIVIFDKFLPDTGKIPLWRRIANLFVTLFGTDLNRRLADMLKGQSCIVAHNEPSMFNGMFRVIMLRK
jgi:ubiquinone/menaquinone biosynthesis C-methylase UbiE